MVPICGSGPSKTWLQSIVARHGINWPSDTPYYVMLHQQITWCSLYYCKNCSWPPTRHSIVPRKSKLVNASASEPFLRYNLSDSVWRVLKTKYEIGFGKFTGSSWICRSRAYTSHKQDHILMWDVCAQTWQICNCASHYSPRQLQVWKSLAGVRGSIMLQTNWIRWHGVQLAIALRGMMKHNINSCLSVMCMIMLEKSWDTRQDS